MKLLEIKADETVATANSTTGPSFLLSLFRSEKFWFS